MVGIQALVGMAITYNNYNLHNLKSWISNLYRILFIYWYENTFYLSIICLFHFFFNFNPKQKQTQKLHEKKNEIVRKRFPNIADSLAIMFFGELDQIDIRFFIVNDKQDRLRSFKGQRQKMARKCGSIAKRSRALFWYWLPSGSRVLI